MDTNLKRSKKTRALIYKLITVAAFFTVVATSLLGRDALINLYKEGSGTYTGQIYYLTEFKEYITTLYTHGVLSYAGIGDDNGYPMTSESAMDLVKESCNIFSAEIQKGGEDILYHIQYINKTKAIRLVPDYIQNTNNLEESGNFAYPLFSEYDGHLLLPEDVMVCCYWDGSDKSLDFFTDSRFPSIYQPENYYTYPYKPNSDVIGNVRLLLAIQNDGTYTSKYFRELDKLARSYQIILVTISVSGAVFLLFGVLSLITGKAGKQALSDCTKFTGKVWLEIKLLLVVLLSLLCYRFNLWFFNGSSSARLFAADYLWLYIPMSIALYLFLKDLSHNRGRAFKNSLVRRFLCLVRDYFKGVAWYRKAANMYIISFICSIFMLLTGVLGFYSPNHLYYLWSAPETIIYLFGFVMIAGGILLLFVSIRLKHFVSDTASITGKLTDIGNGSSGAKMSISKHSLLKQAASDLNDVEHGIETAVEQTIKSNKLRVELITNVSHDLKTPLTSIINYADLLCEEELPKPAGEYAAALRSKAYRLKGMVQDVFELSKATSGNLPVEKVRLDLAKLLRQTLADMDERIQQSSLTFKLVIASEPLMIEADGEKLYRVFQNLIINALQYSLENSRVYIQLDKKDSRAVAWIKNTSRQELDFDPEEIVERFVRADASRTTEGSGLGLSIVQSFTEACGGSFSIELNADLFTACVSFPLSEEPADPTPENKGDDMES